MGNDVRTKVTAATKRVLFDDEEREEREKKKSLIEIRTHFGARSALKCFVLISLSKNSMQDLKASLITMTSLVPCDGVTENASAT